MTFLLGSRDMTGCYCLLVRGFLCKDSFFYRSDRNSEDKLTSWALIIVWLSQTFKGENLPFLDTLWYRHPCFPSSWQRQFAHCTCRCFSTTDRQRCMQVSLSLHCLLKSGRKIGDSREAFLWLLGEGA